MFEDYDQTQVVSLHSGHLPPRWVVLKVFYQTEYISLGNTYDVDAKTQWVKVKRAYALMGQKSFSAKMQQDLTALKGPATKKCVYCGVAEDFAKQIPCHEQKPHRFGTEANVWCSRDEYIP